MEREIFAKIATLQMMHRRYTMMKVTGIGKDAAVFGKLMKLLQVTDGIKVSDAVYLLGVNEIALDTQIRLMMADELVEKDEDNVIRLTEKGKNYEEAKATKENIFSKVDEKDIKNLLELLDKLIAQFPEECKSGISSDNNIGGIPEIPSFTAAGRRNINMPVMPAPNNMPTPVTLQQMMKEKTMELPNFMKKQKNAEEIIVMDDIDKDKLS